jgi:hypothetical protein
MLPADTSGVFTNSSLKNRVFIVLLCGKTLNVEGMRGEKILYTDGHQVTVTNSFIRVKKSLYSLEGITRHCLLIIHPDKLPALLVLVVGAMLITMGALHLIPKSTIPDVEFYSFEVNANAISLVLGIVLLGVGASLMWLMKDRYAVRIETAEGEKNVVVSPSKEYIALIVDALNQAFVSLVSPKGKGERANKGLGN